MITSRGKEGACRCAGRLSVYLSNIAITSLGEEGRGRCAGRLSVYLSNIVIRSRGEEGAGRCAGRLLVYQRFMVSRFITLLRGARGGLRSVIVTLPFHCFFLYVCYNCNKNCQSVRKETFI